VWVNVFAFNPHAPAEQFYVAVGISVGESLAAERLEDEAPLVFCQQLEQVLPEFEGDGDDPFLVTLTKHSNSHGIQVDVRTLERQRFLESRREYRRAVNVSPPAGIAVTHKRSG
jgi:hypothetical protein